MAREILNELLPLVPVLRRRNVLFVPEGMQRVRIGGKLFGREAELDEWADVILEQAVVDLIDIGEVVYRLAVFVLVVKAGFARQNGVEPNAFQTRNPLGFP